MSQGRSRSQGLSLGVVHPVPTRTPRGRNLGPRQAARQPSLTRHSEEAIMPGVGHQRTALRILRLPGSRISFAPPPSKLGTVRRAEVLEQGVVLREKAEVEKASPDGVLDPLEGFVQGDRRDSGSLDSTRSQSLVEPETATKSSPPIIISSDAAKASESDRMSPPFRVGPILSVDARNRQRATLSKPEGGQCFACGVS